MSTDFVRVLVVDDDREIGRELADYLARFGMRVQVLANGAELRRELRAGSLDVLLLDLMLPGEDGLSLCQWVKATQPELPVIMLTAQGDPASRVVGLEIGADDYLPKPFEPRELVARIKAVLRRGAAIASRAQAVVRFERWSFDRMRRELTAPDGTLVALSALESRLLGAFLDHAGQVLSRDRLIDLAHSPDAIVNDRAVDLAVSRLRAKLGDPGRDATLIRTMRGEGYLFDAKALR